MLDYLFIFLGGGFGAGLRYFLSVLSSKYLGITYPFGTFFINILGCLFLGFIATLAINKTGFNPNLKIFLTVGFAGGFTTFSTFGYESLVLLKNGEIGSAILYVLSSVLVGLLFVYLGSTVAKMI